LEKRLADLESRTPAKPSGDLAQPEASVATAKPAADSTGLSSAAPTSTPATEVKQEARKSEQAEKIRAVRVC